MIHTQREGRYAPIPCYTDVEAELLAFDKDVRVLPAPYYDQPSQLFTLKKRHEPSDNAKGFPNGGFEVYDSTGGIYNYDLDQVITHPYAIGKLNYFKSDTPQRDKVVDPNAPKAPRGRKSTKSAEQRAEEQAFKESRKGMPRGRPSTLTPEERETKRLENLAKLKLLNTSKPGSGKKRGRQPLSPEEKTRREAEAALKPKGSGKRGRPKRQP